MSILAGLAAAALAATFLTIVVRYALAAERELRALDLSPGDVIFRGPFRARR
jgi:hypothetical protein